MADERDGTEAPPGERPDEEARVRECCEAIDRAAERYADEWGVDWHVVDLAVFTAAASHAVEAQMTREEFVETLAAMYDECREIGEYEDVMSTTWGEA